MLTKIITDRLTLDNLTIEDSDFMHELLTSRGWIEFIGSRNVHSKEDAINYIKKINSTPDLNYWVVRTKNTNTPIGIISFLKRAYLEHFDIGFAFLPAYHGQNYAYEAAGEVLAMVSQNPLYAIVFAATIPKNISSIQLLRKLGFHFYKEMEVANEKLHVYSNVTVTL